MSRLETLRAKAQQLGLAIDTWAPGDGTRRYRLLRPIDGCSDFFGADPIWTALGIGDAERMMSAFCAGYYYGRAEY